jgi:hypothetical protein
MSYLIVSWNSSGSGFTRQVFPPLKHVRFPLATPGTEACDAMGGAFRPQWRELPAIVLRLSLQCCPKPVQDRCQARRSLPKLTGITRMRRIIGTRCRLKPLPSQVRSSKSQCNGRDP